MLLQRNQGVALGTSHLNSRPYHGHRKPHNRGPNRGAQQRGIVSRREYRRACKYGLKCKYLFTGTCHYDHTEYELAEYRRKWAEQVAELNQGLDDLELVVRAGEGVRVDANVDSIGIADVQELASFNKTSDGEIAVPGHPPRFTSPTQALEVPNDAGNETSDFRSPRYKHHFEPLLQSVKIMQPSFDMLDSVDVISNAGNLRRLFDLLCNERRAVNRFDLEMRGNTLLFSRWNDDPQLNLSSGCGAGFEKQTCQYALDDDPILQRSASHHRVVSYCFGGLQCVVQSEVDGYCCDCDHPDELDFRAPSPTNAATAAGHKKRQSDPPAPTIRKLSGLTRSRHRPSRSTDYTLLDRDDPGDSPTFTPPTPPTTTPTLRIHHTGKFIPAPCLVEIKTHNARSHVKFSTHQAQMYFSRRPQLYSAQHENRVFRPGPGLAVKDVTQELVVWEREQQGRLQQLAALLRLVREKVASWCKEEGVERFSLVCECDGEKGDGGVWVKLCKREAGEEGGLLPP